MDLVECLHVTAQTMLLAVCRARGISVARGAHKVDLVASLHEALGGRRARDLMAALSGDELAAAQGLAARGGDMALDEFCRAFGAIRPYRPWRPDSPAHPWRSPVSAAERLVFMGVIYVVSVEADQHQAPRVVLPAEFASSLIPPSLAPERVQESRPAAAWPDPVLDVAVFLAYLQSAHVALLHGRWLSPRHLRSLGACLLPPETVAARGELQAERVRFVHYLAEALDLILPVQGWLKPAPAASQWLDKPYAEQLRTLWSAWLSPSEINRARWARYRLPGHRVRDPAGLATRLASVLATIAGDGWLSLADLWASSHLALHEIVPWWESDDIQSEESQSSLLQNLLQGPLTWLSAVECHVAGDDVRCRLTLRGAWLQGQEAPVPARDVSRSWTITAEVPLLAFEMAGSSDLSSLLAVADWAAIEPGRHFSLSAASIARAVEHGGTADDLMAVLARCTTPALTASEQDALRAWARRTSTVTLRPCLLLETDHSDHMDRLWAQRSIREHLGRRLGPSLATVQAVDPRALVTALRRGGVAVRSLVAGVAASRQASPQASPAASGPATAPDAGDAVWLAVAVLVQGHLARRLGMSPVPPAAVLDRLLPLLGPAGLAAAEAAAAGMIARLEETLDGLPLAVDGPLLAVLQRAVAAGEALCLRYRTPWRGEITERKVWPLRLEWRGDRVYLVAHCELRQAERSFRLDRILDATRCGTDPGATPAPAPGS